jgi:hypothetical protein
MKEKIPQQLDFIEQQDAADPDFIPRKKDEAWRLRQMGEDVARLAELDYKKEAARKNIIAKKALAKIKRILQ